MATKFQHNSLLPSSSSNPWVSHKATRMQYSCKKVSGLDRVLSCWGNSRKKCLIRLVFLENTVHAHRKHSLTFRSSRRMGNLILFASADDGVTVNGTPQASTSSVVEEMRVKLNQTLHGEEYSDGLVQFLHDAARVFELAIKEQGSWSRFSWFATSWLGADRNAWVKTLSYQASAYSLLQAASEIASRGDGRDRDINLFVQKSLLRQSASLESLMRDKLSTKQPEAYEWFWSEQVPLVVSSFVNYIEGDSRFTAATSVSGKGMSLGSVKASDISLLMLGLTCNAAITKLGSAKVSCSQFFTTIPEITGRLMDMLVDFIPISEAYRSIKDIGLRREFLVHFGPRAAACRVKNDRASEEVIFWVDLVQKQLQRAIDREKIWSRLTTSESIEVLERDLAIFGFFVALGRSTQSFLSANGFDVMDDPLEGFVRFLIGGSVLYYPQLSSISSYQLYVEVVCEELDWLPFYPGNIGNSKQFQGHRSEQEIVPNAEAIPQVLEVCSYWMQSFIKYSKWLENPSNIKAANFLSKGHNKLMECMEAMGISKNEKMENRTGDYVERIRTGAYSPTEKESDSFDKALESVEGALVRLEKLLQDLHVSSSNSGKEHLKAACSDLEKIRKLKKEAEFLEASFRAKAASLRQGDDYIQTPPSVSEQQQILKGSNGKVVNPMAEGSKRITGKNRGLWSIFMRPTTRKANPEIISDEFENEFVEQTASNICAVDSESNEINRFEHLRNELIELEKRVQRSTGQSENEEDVKLSDASVTQLFLVQKKENIIEKSFGKLKEASIDVLQGTQLLAVDVTAAMGLLRRTLIGDELTEKEKKSLRRTMTDLASVVPIGVLMLLPVTAVGHAAILAAIQRYVPALIPSTYGTERLDLLRQLEKVKEMETSEENPDGGVEEAA
ncbi:uncharacterized protein LOC107415073 [Ziziphus jujuba]|uniref:Uncharacterized protein LOC107415073 n=1 Tax=Ziziphus jujuba TaxID=326968 RepID=A0A6P3ZK11_ZIZJJ|nr:uncharacterized protein LOC107415073 [Ziziphus jujuba]XP_048320979.2 uncharacterized protein LOC107415073 [Ziziphus jujuba]